MPIKPIYFRKSREVLLEQFAKICKTEGVTQGEKLCEWIEPYVARHRDGNPQTKLDFAGEVKTLPKYTTCQHSQKLLSGGLFYGFYNQPRFGHSPGVYPPVRCGRCDYYRPED